MKKPEINTDKALDAILAEYNSRATEIQNRSAAENTFLQLHITALTAILGGIITMPHNSHWIVFLIPIESSLFGLWWMGNSSPIWHNGRYVRKFIEPKVNKLLKFNQAMYWETYIFENRGIAKKSETPVHNLVFITFTLPSIISVAVSTLLIFISILINFGPVAISNYLQFTAVFPGYSLIFAIICLLINIYVLKQFMYKNTELGRQINNATD